MAVCRVCRRPFAPKRSWFHTCPECFTRRSSPSARLGAMAGQMTIFDAVTEPEEPSAFIRWADANPVAGTAAA